MIINFKLDMCSSFTGFSIKHIIELQQKIRQMNHIDLTCRFSMSL